MRTVHLGSPGCQPIGWQLPRDHVALFCANGHDHLMGWEQAQRLYLEPCCWCGAPMVRAIHGPNVLIRLQLPRRVV